MSEVWMSVLGGGLVAAFLTLGFNAWWDCRKQKLAEDWEFRRYHANQIHYSTAGIMEVYFSAKSELYYLTCTLEALLGILNDYRLKAGRFSTD